MTLFSMLGGGSGVGRTLRVGRILRPLRMINRNEGMKVIVDALLRSLPAVFYAVVRFRSAMHVLWHGFVCSTRFLFRFCASTCSCATFSTPTHALTMSLYEEYG